MFYNTPANFIGGQLHMFRTNWEFITNDNWILNILSGYHLELDVDRVPNQKVRPKCINFNESESALISKEIDIFLIKQIIELVPSDKICSNDGFYSNIFIRQKKDGGVRVILNLKKFNDYVDKKHFKMETLYTALNNIKSGQFMASIDLKDAYFSVLIHESDRKYLRFIWNNVHYQFRVLPQGLSCSPRVFTKLLKPVYGRLREKGFINVPYIDDSLILGDSFNECVDNIQETSALLDKLGFTVHPEKSVFVPTQEIIFLGFVINTVKMLVTLTQDRIDNLLSLCEKLLLEKVISIREFAKLIGKMVASEPGVQYAPLYYKDLEHFKDKCLKYNNGNFDAKIRLDLECQRNIVWWINNLKDSFKPIIRPDPSIVLYSDSSKSGWGGYNETSGLNTNGHWSTQESEEHINYLELKAGFLSLQSLTDNVINCHIRLYMDNTVAVAYINNFGGKIESLHKLSKEIWLWCITRQIWLSAAHVAGKENIIADKLSRKLNEDMEWKLNPTIFKEIELKYGEVIVDLFASRYNCQKQCYVSFLPDKNAMAIDAFSLNWNNINKLIYMFPPFSLLGKVVQKIHTDKVETALVVAPVWRTQVWFPRLLQQLCAAPYLLPLNCLLHPLQREKVHPVKNLQLGIFCLSGRNLKIKEYQETLPTSLSTHGENLQANNISPILKDGNSFVIKGKLIVINPLL